MAALTPPAHPDAIAGLRSAGSRRSPLSETNGIGSRLSKKKWRLSRCCRSQRASLALSLKGPDRRLGPPKERGTTAWSSLVESDKPRRRRSQGRTKGNKNLLRLQDQIETSVVNPLSFRTELARASVLHTKRSIPSPGSVAHRTQETTVLTRERLLTPATRFSHMRPLTLYPLTNIPNTYSR